jgi:arabinofuranan 3-O-arabinosyltransferase
MTTYELPSAYGAGDRLRHPIETVCFALVVAQVVYLVASYAHGLWLLAPDGSGIATDFVTVWAAGKMAIAGHAAAAYDWQAQKTVEESAVGHPFAGYYGWPYPPTFLLAAAVISALPYVVAFVVWIFGTFVAYVATIRAITGDRIGYLLAPAFPAVLSNFLVGQNGFLSAALVGGTLTLMNKQPTYAGVLLGLLTYKPHFGVLFPVVLLATGRWRVFITAGTVAVVLAAASWAIFGYDCWLLLLPGVAHTSQALLSDGLADWGKLQTAFGLARTLGASETFAWAAQIAVSLTATVSVVALWRSNVAYEIKAAALATAVLLVTPYLFIYDLAILAVPVAFLFRLSLDGSGSAFEIAGIGLACLLILVFPFVKAPVGFFAVLVVAGLIVRRALAARTISP